MTKLQDISRDLEAKIERAIQNIDEDRDATKGLIDSLAKNIHLNNGENHKQMGPVMAKYLESLQRGNEQLVKLIAIRARQVSASEFSSSELTDDEKDGLYEEIQQETLKKRKGESKKK